MILLTIYICEMKQQEPAHTQTCLIDVRTFVIYQMQIMLIFGGLMRWQVHMATVFCLALSETLIERYKNDKIPFKL